MGKITILNATPKKPFELMGFMAGECWGSDTSSDDKNRKRGMSCVADGHGRVWELADIYMKIEGYSARVMREWYTHIGCLPTRLQASTRYINYNNLEVIKPNAIKANEEASKEFDKCIAQIKESYGKLIDLGITKEDTANILPLGMTTVVMDKRNARNLIEMSHQRLCGRAYWEYRQMMRDIMKALSEYSDEWKFIVDTYMMPKCEAVGYCTEKRGCGRMPHKNEIKNADNLK
jgi:thymidylate synthase (FAD)